MLILKDFGISFSDRNLLEGITIEIPEGTIFHIKGPNASGKTSLLNAISGIIPEYVKAKTKGSILMDNINLQTIPLAEKFHYLWYQLSDAEAQLFFPNCISELAFALENKAVPEDIIQQKILLATEQFGLTQFLNRDPSTLSGGEKKMLLCAVAETIDPPILLLDEPLNGLDNRAMNLILNWLKTKKEQGKIIVIAEHNPIIDEFADFSLTLAAKTQPLKIADSLLEDNHLSNVKNIKQPIMSPVDVLFQIDKLSFAYSESEPLFENLSYDIHGKDNILLKGSNGAGKSTLLKLLTGLLTATEGKIYLSGKPMQSGVNCQNFNYAYYQSQITKENLLGISVAQNWLFWQIAIENLPNLELKDDPLFTELSSGQQKMVSQQILPYLFSKFWLLDEPFASLDENASDKLIKLLQYKSEHYPGMLIVSHSLEEHQEMFDKVLIIENKSLREENR
ncbi:MAG: ATP-binding cassette domain-containing protein [Candidatus Cloacimonas sp.]